MKRSFLVLLHTITGLTAGIFILLLSVSGTLLVFQDETDSWQKPRVAATGQPHVPVNSCYKFIRQQYPNAEISSCQLPVKTNSVYSFFIYDSLFNNAATARELFLHPYNGRIIATRGGSEDWQHNFTGWLAKFHNSFHAGKKGEWVLGVVAVLFVLSLSTGIIIYRKSVVTVILFRKEQFSRRNLHQLLGVYALLFNLLMAITGFWMQRYVFKKAFYTGDSWIKTSKPSPAPFYNFDSAWAAVKEQHPGFTPHVIYFAQSTKSKTAVYGSNASNGFIHSKKFADVIALDSSGAIASTRFVNENTPADYYDIVNSQLHMGKYGGWPVKLIYGLLGITSGLLSITGFILWLKKRRGRKLPR